MTRRLNQLLSPLGDWPFGKTLRVSDVYEAILDDPGVRFAEQITLTTELGPEGDTARLFADPHQPRCHYALMADGLYRSLDYATSWEREPLERLARDGQLGAWEHRGFWQPMDTLRDRQALDDLWNSGNPPWKVW